MKNHDEPVGALRLVQHAVDVDLTSMLGGYWNHQYWRLVSCSFSNMRGRALMRITILFAKLRAFQELVAETTEFALVKDSAFPLDCFNQFSSSRNYNV
jgi:hypothetical protein